MDSISSWFTSSTDRFFLQTTKVRNSLELSQFHLEYFLFLCGCAAIFCKLREYHPHFDSVPEHLWRLAKSRTIGGSRSTPIEEVPQKKSSKEYEEGYDQGFDDGEEDAIDRNGFASSYDESCKYNGRKKRDYEEGYDDGYNDGYESGKYESEEDGYDEEGEDDY